MPKKLQEIFPTVAIVCYRYERLAVLQNVFAIILLWATNDVENFSKKLYTRNMKKKRKVQRFLGTLKMPKLAQIFKQSSWICQAVRGRYVSHTRLRLACHFFVFTTFWRHLWSLTEHRTATWNVFVKLIVKSSQSACEI